MMKMTNSGINTFSSEEKRALAKKLLQQKIEQTKTSYPLSHGQKALWFLNKNNPTSTSYNIAVIFKIANAINVPVLKSALQRIINRHEILRTTYSMENGEPVQIVHSFMELFYAEIDVSGYNETKLLEELKKAKNALFDLTNGPLLRVYLFKKSICENHLLICTHHIAFDGWSILVLLEELKFLYSSIKYNSETELPDKKFSYSDYTRLQKEFLTTEDADKQLLYWQNELRGEIPIQSLYTDFPRPAIQTENGSSVKLELTVETINNLKEFSKAYGLTTNVILLGTLKILLSRYTQQDDIIVGTPTTGRTKPEWLNLLGYFVNPVAIRSRLSGEQDIISFFKETRTKVINALSNQDYPFPLLVNKLKLKRDPSRNPVFQTLFALQKYDQQFEISRLLGIYTENMDTLEMEPYEMPQTEGQVDLSVEFYESKSKLFGYFHYNTSLFERNTIQKMAFHYEELLKNTLIDTHQKVTSVGIISEPEEQQLVQGFNNTAIEIPSHKCIHEIIEMQAKKIPLKIAMVFQDRQISYEEMDQLSNQLSNYIINCGIKTGDHVGISMDRSLDMLIAMIAVLKAGAAYVPLDPVLPNERLSFMANDSGIRLLLTQEKYATQFSGSLNKVLLDQKDVEIKKESTEKPLLTCKPESLAYIIYTSGSTGQPKGVMVEHRQVVNFFNGIGEKLKDDTDVCWLALASISFDISIQELLWPLTRGFKVLIQKNDLNEIINENNFSLSSQIVKHHATHLICAYSMIRLLSSNSNSLNSIRKLKKVFLGGEPLNKSVIESIFNGSSVEIYNVYGPTETTVFSTFTKLSNEDKVLTIGKPMANTQVYILDRNMQLLPIGVPGEIYISGESVARGYIGKEELTLERFIKNPFSINSGNERIYKTGDIGRYLEDGNIEFIGRNDSQIKIRGHRIELGEIEFRIRQCRNIKDCALIIKKIHEEDKIVAFIVAGSDPVKEDISNELKRYIQQFLPEYMQPSYFIFIKELPLTQNQKLDVKYLQNYHIENSNAAFRYPHTEIEKQLVKIWKNVLGVERIGTNDNFFNVGGDSILAIQIISKANQEGIYIQPGHLFQFQTIRELANAVEKNVKVGESKSLLPLQTKGDNPPIFFVPGSGGNAMYLQKLSHYMGNNQPFYGLQAIGIDGSRDPLKSIEEIAGHYVNEIMDLFSEGPCYIAGHSFGAWVAYEMAMQLSNRGKKVEFLGLLDMYAPESIERNENLSLEDDAVWYVKIVDMLNRLFNLNIEFTLDELNGLSEGAQLLLMKSKLEAVRLLPENSDPLLIKGLLNIQKSNSRIDYKPKEKYNGPISLIRADLEVDNDDFNFSGHFVDDEFFGWRKSSTFEVSVSYTKGDHLSMMREPNVIYLAETINRLIKEEKK